MDDMKRYYAQRAPEYDEVYQKPERQASLRRLEAWLPPLLAGRSVLDLACGTGYWTRFYAPGARSVLGVDAAEQTLAIASGRVRVPGVRFELGDAYAPPAGDFDACFAGFWLSHVPRARWREWMRTALGSLQAGGRLVLLDNLYIPGSSRPPDHTDAHGDNWQVRTLRDGSVHEVMKNYPTEAQLHAAGAGLAGKGCYQEWDYYWSWVFDKD